MHTWRVVASGATVERMPTPRLKMALGAIFVSAALVIVVAAGEAGAPRSDRPAEERTSGGPSHSGAFEFVSDEPGSRFECRLDGSAWRGCNSPKLYFDLPRGPHNFEVRASDRAGNVDATPARRSWTVDGTGATDDPPPAGTTARTPPQMSETTPPETIGVPPPQPGTTPPVPTETAPPKTDTTTSPETGDATSPETMLDSAPSGYLGADTASFAFSAGEPATFECRLDAGVWEACQSPQRYVALADGPHTFEVRATDAAGNRDETPARRDWVVDTDPPETTITRGPAGAPAQDAAKKPRRSQGRAPWGSPCREQVRPSGVARRVELVRGIEFRFTPRVELVSPARFRRQLEIADAGQARLASSLHAPTDLPVRAHAYGAFARITGVRRKLRGVGEHGWGLAAAELYARAPRLPAASGRGGAVGAAAVYDGTRKFVFVDRRAVGCAAEYALAHELTRALEAQWRPEGWKWAPLPEAWLTDRAVDEGVASGVAARYAVRYLGASSVSDVLAWQRRLAERGSVSPQVEESRAFVYRDGPRFVGSLIKRAGLLGGPQKAYVVPPYMTAEIMHPDHPRGDVPYYADPGDVPSWMSPLEKHAGGRWTYAEPGNIEIGELDTVVLLRAGLGRRQARRAAAGMYGGTFLVLQCVERCRGDYAALAGWAWRNPREADEFAGAVPRFLAAVLGAHRAGRSTWLFDGGAAAVAVEGCITGLAFAPSGFLAARLARAPIDRPAIPARPCQAAPG